MQTGSTRRSGLPLLVARPLTSASLTHLAVEFVAVAFVEIQRNNEPDVEKKKYPGGPFDPFDFSKGANLEELKLKEIKNGRLAILAFLGFVVQAIAYLGTGPLENLKTHLADLWHQNIAQEEAVVSEVFARLEQTLQDNALPNVPVGTSSGHYGDVLQSPPVPHQNLVVHTNHSSREAIVPSLSAYLHPKCALWDCPRPARGGNEGTYYYSSFHEDLAINEGAPRMVPAVRPGGIDLKDGPLFCRIPVPLVSGSDGMKSSQIFKRRASGSADIEAKFAHIIESQDGLDELMGITLGQRKRSMSIEPLTQAGSLATAADSLFDLPSNTQESVKNCPMTFPGRAVSLERYQAIDLAPASQISTAKLLTPQFKVPKPVTNEKISGAGLGAATALQSSGKEVPKTGVKALRLKRTDSIKQADKKKERKSLPEKHISNS